MCRGTVSTVTIVTIVRVGSYVFGDTSMCRGTVSTVTIVTIVRVGSHVFGGYTDVSWHSKYSDYSLCG